VNAVRTSRLDEHRPVRLAVLVLVVLAALHPFTQSDLVILVCGTVTVALCRRRPARAKPMLLASALPFAFAGWAALGTAWSPLPAATLREALMIAVLAAAARSAVRSLPWPVLLTALSGALRLLLICSAVVAVAVPSIGAAVASDGAPAIKGIFVHRNVLAFVAVVALALALFTVHRGSAAGLRKTADVALAAGCLVLAQSSSALVAGIVLVVVLVWLRSLAAIAGRGARVLAAVVGVAGAAGLAQVVLSNGEQIIRGLGRDTTLTGRTDVWEAVLDEVRLHPASGLGWGAAWHEGLPATERMWSAAGFAMFHAHNGYLDVLLQVGVVGCVLGAGFVLVALATGLRGAVVGRAPAARWAFATVVSLLVLNGTESYFGSALGWVVLQFAFFAALRSTTRPPPAAARPAGGVRTGPVPPPTARFAAIPPLGPAGPVGPVLAIPMVANSTERMPAR
jgi:O-antigen ligase